MLSKYIILTHLVVLVLANSLGRGCRRRVVDDFRSEGFTTIYGELRQVNGMGGDYAAQNLSFETNLTASLMKLTPANGSVSNVFSMKFHPYGCFDLREYTHFEFELSAPLGSTFQIGFTARATDCYGKGTNSVETAITRYTKPDGTFQLVQIPMTDFSKNVAGTDFEWIRTQDIRFTNLQPNNGNATFFIKKINLVGSCDGLPYPKLGPSGASSPSPTGLIALASPTKAPTASPGAVSSPQASSGNIHTAGLVSGIFAAVTTIFLW